MGKCTECGTIVEDKYKYCLDCLKKIKEGNQNADTVSELGKLNNNLYYLRRGLAIILREKYNKKVDWNKAKKDFEESDFK